MNQSVVCPLCGAECSNAAKAYPGDDPQQILGIRDIVECRACGLGFASPMPTQEQLDGFYANGTYWHEQVIPRRVSHLHALAQSIARASWCARWIDSGPKFVADVGAGYGWQADGQMRVFGETMDQYCFVEPDDHAAQAILKRLPALDCRRIPDLSQESTHDLIFLNQVIEHVASPAGFLSKAKSALAMGGHIYIETPNRDDRFKRDVFPHTLFFSRDALCNLVKVVGMEVVTAEAFGKMPGAGPLPFFMRMAFRACSALGWRSAALMFDRLLWRYRSPSESGIWLRILARRID